MSSELEKPPRYSVSQAARQAQAVEKSRLVNKSWSERRRELRKSAGTTGTWKRETLVLPREQARDYARKYFRKYPKAAYWSEVESWRPLENDVIEFTLRRLPSAD